jgi:2-polyprenyl-6-methoxyphenol hydroxylase-like FAD-dependent oxidoreductase
MRSGESTIMPAETFALIVGGGPVGLAAAIELGWRSVPTVLVTDKLDTAQHPKCNNTNARSMEHFRRLGIAGELRSEGLPPHIERASAYVTRFCGHEFGRLPRPYSDWPTPEIPNNVSQIVLERCCGAAPSARRRRSISAGGSIRLTPMTTMSRPRSSR